MASSTGHVMNLSNSIIGVSLLAMPFCFKQCGITLAIIMLILSSIISRLACHFLVKSSTMCRRRNFEFLAFYTFGPSGKLLVELGVIGFMMGTCVAFFVVMGDLGPAIISKIFDINNNSTLRTSVLIGLGVLVVLPLGLLRNVESLAAISTVTIGYYFLFIVKIFFESSPHLASGDWWAHVKFWQPEGVLQCVPIFAMALSCQTQLFEIYNSLPSPSIEKMNSVVRSALNLCTVVYTSVGLLGYIAYCKGNFSGNIMLSFTPSLSSEMFKLGFVLSIAVSFPLVIFPCRASLFSLMFKRMPIHQELSQTSSHIPDSRFKGLTVAIVSVALITGLLIPSIELVLGFVGSTIGIAICVIFPSLSFLNLYNKNTNERIIAKLTLVWIALFDNFLLPIILGEFESQCSRTGDTVIFLFGGSNFHDFQTFSSSDKKIIDSSACGIPSMILFLGVVIMITGTFGNLFAAVEHKSTHSSHEEMGNSKYLQQIKLPLKMPSSTEMTKKHNGKDVSLVAPDKPVLLKSQEVLKPQIKILENVRKEPPVPIAPLPSNKEKQNKQELQIDKIREDARKKTEVDQKKANSPKGDFAEVKHNENINKDAIEKEDREIMELEQQKKAEEDRKQQELLQRLKEHHDEQKKLLQEQEKILKEMKDRKNENKLKEEPKDPDPFRGEAKTAKPDRFRVNLNKNQNVVDDLKDAKNSLEKEKSIMEKEKTTAGKNASLPGDEPKGSNSRRKAGARGVPERSKEEKAAVEAKGPAASVPLPLAKRLPSETEGEKKRKRAREEEEGLKSKQEVLGRDILVERTPGREKRDAEEEGREKCVNEESQQKAGSGPGGNEKTERVGVEKKNLTQEMADGRSTALIKNSAHLSVSLGSGKKPEMSAVETSNLIFDFQNQPFMSKKRDLKSISTTNS